ncbi:MAG: YicC/YloC family endoribonuclease [Flavobacteriales bacterium]
MLKSMTGYGKAEATIGTKKFTVEIKSLNSKQLDIYVKMPSVYKEKELNLRSHLSNELERGKVELTIYYDSTGEDKKVVLNKPLVEAYHKDFKEVAERIGQENVDYMSMIMRIPDVLKAEKAELDLEEWNGVLALVKEALIGIQDYRTVEGQKLEVDFEERINNILQFQKEVQAPVETRLVKIKERIKHNVEEVIDPDKIDSNRFEQELVFYLEKLDISEENQRLKSNCDYFLEILRSNSSQGKKLGFIAQEIGREINTMGSKANDADVQRLVVKMKDELEKIKEQILNAL